jgi:CRP/FNR family transcriptional regulator
LVKVSGITEDGTEVIKYIVKPGNFFGEFNLLDTDENRNDIAIALEDAEVYFIPADTIKFLMKENELLRSSINKAISKRISKMEKRMFSLMMKGVRERTLDFLKDFVAEFGHPVAGGYQARNFLTHDDIAKMITSSRQTVTSSLVYFRRKGWIDYDSKHLKVFNLQAA